MPESQPRRAPGDVTAAEFEAAGLYDPAAPNAADRLALLEWLTQQGVSVEQMLHGLGSGSLASLAGDLALRPGERLRVEQLAAELGMSADYILRIRLASGIPPTEPDAPMFTREDAAILRAFQLGAEQFGEPFMLAFARVVGSSLARVAEAAISLYLVNVERPLMEASASELDLARANLEAMRWIETVPPVLEALFRAHLETAIRRSRRARARAGSNLAQMTVGFVDLVGFTPLTRQLTSHELGALVDRFETQANDITTARDGRLVKIIGDEVMFVAVDAAAACDIALTLVDRFRADASVTPRGGLATGTLLMRGGDYYGPIVNLASRIADLAVPREVLVTAEVVADAGVSALHFEPAGKRMLKGFDAPVTLYAAGRAPAPQ
jgi:adenylate cyclase